ncbi:MAG: YraN family protein [Clostridia bacterium]
MKLTEIFSSVNLSKKEIGNKGEELAVRHLKRQGYKILERNFSVPKVGEIDIVAMDGEYLCFVEVRLRSRADFGTPAQTVTSEKRRRIIRAAQAYLIRGGLERSLVRFDVVEVYGVDTKPVVIKDAFWVN